MAGNDVNVFQEYIHPLVCRMGGFEDRDYNKVRSNLENSHRDNLAYLGTYFPRSALESYSLFSYLLDTIPALRKATAQKKSIKVLDFGCGTGGELIGLFLAFYRVFGEETPAMEVHAVDGNRDAMNLARQAVNSFAESVEMDVKLSLTEHVVSEQDYLKSQMEALGPFDIIVTSKFLNEVNGMFDKPYLWFAASMMPLLAKDGIAVFMEVTCQPAGGGEYFGLQMYTELGEFQLEDEQFRTLFPIVCDNKWCRTHGCRGFPQLVFDFSELGYPTRTNLACRVMCQNDLWQQVRREIEPAMYWLKNTSLGRGYCMERGGQDRIAPMPAHCINVPEN